MQLSLLGVNGPYPASGGACSGYLVQEAGQNLLIDCGAGVGGRLLERVSIEDLSAVVLTHLHFDHMSDLLALRYAVDFSARGPLPVYLPDEPGHLRALFEGGKLDLRPCADAMIAGFFVRFQPAKHPMPGYCLSVERGGKRLVYTGDTNLYPALSGFAQGCDLLLADSAFLQARWSPEAPHMSARVCGKLAAQAKAKRLVLTHLIPGADQAALLDEASAAFPGAVLARQGMTIEV